MPDHLASPHLARETLLAEAGYGCVICGSPIFKFVAGDSTEIVLCPEHSSLYESGQIDQASVAQSASHPFNSEHAEESGVLRVSSKYPVARFKGVIVVNDELKVSADEETLLNLRVLDGRLMVTVRVFDASDALKVHIVDNEWLHGDPQEVSIDHLRNKLMIGFKSGAPVLSIDTNGTPIQLTADLSLHGVPISIGKRGVSIKDRPAKLVEDGYAGYVFEIDTTTQVLTMAADQRHHGHSILVTERDPFQRIVKSLNAMGSLRAHVEDAPFDED